MKFILYGDTMVFLPADYMRRYNIPKCDAIPTAFSSQPDDSCPFSDDILIQDKNPDRGFRGELYLTLGTQEAYPQSGKNCYDFFSSAYSRFREENVHLYQLYVYLSAYYRTPLDAAALKQLTEYFQVLRDYGLRVLLRFAYETESNNACPSTRLMSENIRILKKWIAENAQLFNAVVYAVQLGMFGYWGEGHSETKLCDKKRIIPEVLDMVPRHMTVMLRHPRFLKYVPLEQLRRCSIHDDFLIGVEHPWGMIPFSHRQFSMLKNMNRRMLCDGEMPWGRDKTVETIDALSFVSQCVGYGLGTLSAEHNYKEDGNAYHLEKWKNEYMSLDTLNAANLPYFPYLLSDGKISVYRYLKYHLGYLLAVSNISRYDGACTFSLYNFGMGVPSGFSLTYTHGGVRVNEDISDLCAFSVKSFTIDDGSPIRIGHNAQPDLYIRLMNAITPDKDGYYIL